METVYSRLLQIHLNQSNICTDILYKKMHTLYVTEWHVSMELTFFTSLKHDKMKFDKLLNLLIPLSPPQIHCQWYSADFPYGGNPHSMPMDSSVNGWPTRYGGVWWPKHGFCDRNMCFYNCLRARHPLTPGTRSAHWPTSHRRKLSLCCLTLTPCRTIRPQQELCRQFGCCQFEVLACRCPYLSAFRGTWCRQGRSIC